MRYFGFLFLIFISVLQAQITWLNPLPQPNQLNDIQIIKNTVYCVGHNSTFLKSNDLGKTWEVKTIGENNYFKLLSFADENYGIIAENFGEVYLTKNGGMDWEKIEFLEAESVQDVIALPNKDILIMTWYKVFRSTDFGVTWELVIEDEYMDDIHFDGDSTIWCSNSKLFKSTTNGESWEVVDSTYDRYEKISTFSNNIINVVIRRAVDGYQFIVRSEDSGDTFNEINSDVYDNPNYVGGLPGAFHLFSPTENRVIVTGGDQVITENLGDNWAEIYFDSLYLDNISNLRMAFTDYGEGLAVGGEDRQFLYRTLDYGKTWLSENKYEFSDIQAITKIGKSKLGIVEAGNFWISEDEGKNWEKRREFESSGPYSNIIKDLEFYDEKFGYLNYFGIEITEDCGNTWTQISNDDIFSNSDLAWGEYFRITGIEFIDRKNIFIVGEVSENHGHPDWGGYTTYKSVFLSSIDSGLTWKSKVFDDDKSIRTIDFTDKDFGLIGCYKGEILKTDDGGNTWEIAYTINREILDSYKLSENNIYFSCTGGLTIYTEDGGKTFVEGWTGNMDSGMTINFSEENVGVMGGFPNNIYITNNKGLNWNMIEVNSNNVINDVEIINGKAIFVGNKGLIFSFENQLLTSVTKKTNEVPADYCLEQNYPNPFNPETTIEFTIPKTCDVNLTIINPIGETVSELINQEMERGKYSVKFNAEKLSSGIYFYKLNTTEFSETKKMVLMK